MTVKPNVRSRLLAGSAVRADVSVLLVPLIGWIMDMTVYVINQSETTDYEF